MSLKKYSDRVVIIDPKIIITGSLACYYIIL